MLPSVTFSDDPDAALTTIGSGAFSSCNKIEQVTLPESLTSLGSSAFSSCESLTSFTFPANIKQVPSSILYYCENLESVTLAEGTTQIGSSAFYYCPKLATINLDGQPLTRIDDSAFGNTGLTSVTLPESLTTMGSSVFADCTKLESANVPSQMKTVPSGIFSGCTSLTSVTLPDGITTVGSSAFQNCKLLPSVALTDQVTTIYSYAFSGCEALVMETLPASLQTIGSYAFQNTKAITAVLTIPESVTKIESDAFNGSGITGVVMTKVPNSFGTEVFKDCKQLATVTLPADMTTIPNYTFTGTTALKSIDLPLTLTKIGDYAFQNSGLETINLPQKLQTIGSYAFYGTQLEEIRVPKNVTSVGSRFAGLNLKLKRAYLGRKQSYTNNSYFDYFIGCDNLELLRVYAGTPPSISSSYASIWTGSNYQYKYYTSYRTNCVLEVPEGQVDIYQATNIWKDFKEIRVFESDDMLNDLDFAVMKDLYKYLNGASWEKPWDVTNQNHSIGKWKGITTEVDAEDDELFYITAIDLTGQGLVGPLPKSVFTLERLKTLNLSHNTIEAKVDTLIAEEYTPLTELNMEGNHLKGDLYPLVSKLPNLTSLNVGYNWLTAYSQPTSHEKLDNYYMRRGFQFVDWTTKTVVVPEELEDEVVIDFTPGTPVDIHSNTLQIYRHESGDYNLSFDKLYRLYKDYYGDMSYYDYEIKKQTGGLWDIYNGNLFKAPKGLVAYTHTMPSYSRISYIFRINWKDGDVNADQTLDVSDLQNVIYYALNEQKPSGQIYNFAAADLNSDNKINVSDIVGCVDLVLDSTEPEATAARIYNKVEGESRNVMTATGNSVLLANADEVAALQLTVSGANAAQLQLNSDLRSRFSVSMRDISDGVRIVVYSPMGNTLVPGEHQLLSGLPAGATVTDVRLVDSEAQRLSVRVFGSTTAIDELMADDMDMETLPIYDLSGRRVGKWNTLPRGIYIVNLNGKQFKVRK
jgi:Leucine-rich repeat (LRR) protein